MNADQIRSAISELDRDIERLVADEQAIEDGIRHIDIDLSNTIAEYVETSGKQPHEYYRWRRKAKWARYHKVNALHKKRAESKELQWQRTQLALRLLALESGYRGQDTGELLRASYHLLMEVLTMSDLTLDSSQLGLIAAVRENIGETHVTTATG
jgi:hypothetical protein